MALNMGKEGVLITVLPVFGNILNIQSVTLELSKLME